MARRRAPTMNCRPSIGDIEAVSIRKSNLANSFRPAKRNRPHSAPSTAGGIFAICCAYCVVKEMKSYLAQKEYKRKMRMLARPPTSSTKVMPEVLVPEGKDKEDAAYENVVLVPSV